MSANKEKMDALVDFLTAAFIVVMTMIVVKASQNGNRADRGDRDGQAQVCE